MKRFCSVLLLVALMITLVPAALADYDYEPAYAIGEVICLGASMRTEPKTSAKRLYLLDNGEQFEILEEDGDWYRIRYQEEEGWILSCYVVENPVHIFGRKGNNPAYAWASTSAKRVGLVNGLEELTVIRDMDNYWLVSFRNAACYVRKTANFWTDTEVKTAKVRFSIEVTTPSDLMAGPAASGWDVYKKTKVGEVYDVVAEPEGWYKVLYNGYFAYVPNTHAVIIDN